MAAVITSTVDVGTRRGPHRGAAHAELNSPTGQKVGLDPYVRIEDFLGALQDRLATNASPTSTRR